jgi:hypothetical protein
MKGETPCEQLEMEIEEVYTDWHSLIGSTSMERPIDGDGPPRADRAEARCGCTYVLPSPPLPRPHLRPPSSSSSAASFCFISTAPRYRVRTQARACAMDIEAGTCAHARNAGILSRRLSAPSSCECGLRMQRNACAHAPGI